VGGREVLEASGWWPWLVGLVGFGLVLVGVIGAPEPYFVPRLGRAAGLDVEAQSLAFAGDAAWWMGQPGDRLARAGPASNSGMNSPLKVGMVRRSVQVAAPAGGGEGRTSPLWLGWGTWSLVGDGDGDGDGVVGALFALEEV
jgi:hypothetical protein